MRWTCMYAVIKVSSHKYPKKNPIFGGKLNFLIMNRIKEVLVEKRIKQTWLAEKLGKSFDIVNSYARNRKQPSLETLYKIARLLQVSVKDLLIEENYQEKENGN